MYRIVILLYDNKLIQKDKGPWMKNREDIENWAKAFKELGYQYTIEKLTKQQQNELGTISLRGQYC